MNFDRLFSFVAFSDSMSFAAAARTLHISQPSLHVQVRKLTDTVGVPLYSRNGRNLRLTEAGKKLAAFGRQVLSAEERALADIRGSDDQGRLVLAAGRGTFLYLLPEVLRRFPKNRWPLRLLPSGAEASLGALVDGVADLAVITAPAVAPPGIVCERLCSVGQKLVMPKTHALASRKRVRLSDLDGVPLICAVRGRPHRTSLEASMTAAGARLEVAVEADGWELMLGFVRAGLAAAVVNDYCTAPRGTREARITGVPTVELCLAHSSGFRHPGAERMIELIRESV